MISIDDKTRRLSQATIVVGYKQENKFSSDVTYQKLYLIYNKIPLLKRYVKKLRRKIEIISIEIL